MNIIAVRNLLVRVGSDVTGLKKGMNEANTTLQKFSSKLSGVMGSIQGRLGVLAGGIGGALILEQGVQDAAKFESLMASLGETMGESREEFIKWQEQVATSLGFSRLESADMASQMALNFKNVAKSQEELTQMTIKMMEAAAVVSNKRGMAMSEVSNRIRSAMNQEVDGAMEMGVNVSKAALKTSAAYQEMANGQPWEKLTQNMQKTILYHHILEQVSTNLGSTIQDTTALRISAFTASLQDVRMALGQAFLPIIHTVIPYLTLFMQTLYKALQVVYSFSKALFGGFKFGQGQKELLEGTKANTSAMEELGEATAKSGKQSKKAGKDAKGGLAAFDEINLLASKGGAGAEGGATAGLAKDGGLEEEPKKNPFTPFTEGLDELAEKFKKLAFVKNLKKGFQEVSVFFKELFKGIQTWWKENGNMIVKGFQNIWDVIKPVVMFIVKFVWESIKGLISGVVQFFQGLMTFIGGVFTGDWKKAWEGLKDMFIGAFKAIWNFMNLTLIGGLRKALVNMVTNGIKAAVKFGTSFKTAISKSIKETITAVIKWFKDFLSHQKKFWIDVHKWISGQVEKITTPMFKLFTTLKTKAGEFWNGFKEVFKGAVKWVKQSLIEPIVNEFEKIGEAFSKGIGEGLTAFYNAIRKPINNLIDILNAIKSKIPALKGFGKIGHLPELAKGGIVSQATLALVGEGSQPEAITPIDKLQGMITTAVTTAMKFNGGGGSGGDVVINLDGRTLARVIIPYMVRENKRIGTNVRINPI